MHTDSARGAPAALNVGIVGGGIAGLSTAIALCRAGHKVEIFERSSFSNEIGAAIHVCPNATRILKTWGFDFDQANAVRAAMGRRLSGETLEVSFNHSYEWVEQEFAERWYFLHRVDLHNGLKQLAAAPGEGLRGATTRLKAEVASVDCQKGEIVLSSGERHVKDLVIVASGVNSRLTADVTGEDSAVQETGQSAFRFLIPSDKLVEAGLSDVLAVGKATLNVAADPDRRIVWYPCRGETLQNFAAIHSSRNPKTEVEAWNNKGSIEDLLDEFKNFHPQLLKTCQMAEDLKIWKLLYRPPIKTWYNGHAALCGDAAHPMLPRQGGAQAIEDAGALEVLFSGLGDASGIEQRLALYQEVRRNRAASIQILSNAAQEHVGRVAAELQSYIDGPVPNNTPDILRHNFGHDVAKRAKDILQQHQANISRDGKDGSTLA